MLAIALLGSAAFGADHFVSPSGSSSGDGSINNPWDLATALAQPSSVQPGDTIWLRGGVYRAPNSNGFSSKLTGTAASPIIVRNYNGERATLDGRGTENTLYIGGSYTWYWGLEIMDSNTNRTPSGCTATIGYSPHPSAWGVATYGPNNKFINMVAHDTAQGFSAYATSPDNEFIGNLSYYNGNLPYPSCPGGDRNHGHGMYMQNLSGLKIVQDNIVGDNADEGLQIYGSGNASVQGFRISGNAFYNTSSWPFPYFQYNMLIAGGYIRKDIQVQNNYSYFTPSYDYGFVNFGQYTPGQDISVQNNVFVGGYTGVSMYDQGGPVNFTGNKVYIRPSAYEEIILQLGSGQTLSSYTWDNNQYYGRNFYNIFSNYDFSGWKSATGFDTNSTFDINAPTGKWIYVRPNKYESKRANVIIYNWDLSSQVAVDLSGVLSPGDPFVVQDAQNFYGPPVASGIYSGSPVNIPMTGLTKATPIGFTAPAHTAPQFGTFVVMSSNSGTLPTQPPADTTAPNVSISAPSNGSTVSGTISVSATASDNIGVVGVQFQVNGSAIGNEVTNAPYTVSWNTANVANGAYTVSAIARDAAGNKTTVSASVTVSNTVSTPPSSTGSFTPIRVHGGGAQYTDSQGTVWSADFGSSGSSGTFSTGHAISNTTSPGLYQTERYGGNSFQYSFAVPNGTYTVNLKFAEIYVAGIGQRIFNVFINGQSVLSNFDIVAQAGGADVALDKSFTTNVTNGQINIQFGAVVNNAKIDGIEILQAGTGSSPSPAPSSGGSITAGSPGNSAQFIKTDTTTQGSWRNVYGNDGFNVVNDTTKYPSYATVTTSGQLFWTWAASSSDVRSLQKFSNPNDRIAATWYSATSFNIDVNLTDGNAHQVAIYCFDWDSRNRAERIDIVDAQSGAVLDSRDVSSFASTPQYLVWNLKGHVTIRVTVTAGINAVVSGIFFGNTTAQFVKTDTTTQGNWRGVYGSDGFNVVSDTVNYPSYAAVTPNGQLSWTWASSTADPRGLQKNASSSDRIAATWYSGSNIGDNFSIDLDLRDGNTHQIAVYCVDWDSLNRSERIDIVDAASGIVLDTRNVSNFAGSPQYLVWNLTGHVIIKTTLAGGRNAVISGIFFR